MFESTVILESSTFSSLKFSSFKLLDISVTLTLADFERNLLDRKSLAVFGLDNSLSLIDRGLGSDRLIFAPEGL